MCRLYPDSGFSKHPLASIWQKLNVRGQTLCHVGYMPVGTRGGVHGGVPGGVGYGGTVRGVLGHRGTGPGTVLLVRAPCYWSWLQYYGSWLQYTGPGCSILVLAAVYRSWLQCTGPGCSVPVLATTDCVLPGYHRLCPPWLPRLGLVVGGSRGLWIWCHCVCH